MRVVDPCGRQLEHRMISYDSQEAGTEDGTEVLAMAFVARMLSFSMRAEAAH